MKIGPRRCSRKRIRRRKNKVFKRFLAIFFLAASCFSLHAQDTITLNVVDVTADMLKAQSLNPLVMKKVDSLILE